MSFYLFIVLFYFVSLFNIYMFIVLDSTGMYGLAPFDADV